MIPEIPASPAITQKDKKERKTKMKNATRVLALLMALTMVFGLAATAFAAEGEYEATDSYVLNFTNQNIEGYEDYDAKRLYASKHVGYLIIDEDGDGKLDYWNNTGFSVLNMINTTKISEGGEGAYASIPVYCVDAITDGVPGHDYRRVNLEDAGYFSDEVAGRLRAVYMNSFPYVTDMEKLAEAVNAWDVDDEYAEVVNLTESEAISATQAAIWALANDCEVREPYYGTKNRFDVADLVDTAIYNQEATEFTENNITALHNYLMDLDAMAPQNTVISEAAFGDASVSYAKQEDDTYTASIKATVTASVDEGDALTLTAVCGDKTSETLTVANGTNIYELTVSGLTAATESITLNIDGKQNAADVFLFDPVGGRDASQTMMGYDDSTLPVHAEQVLNLSVLNIHKYSPVEGDSYIDKTPLANITFDIYYVGTMDDYVNNRLGISAAPTEEDIAKYAKEENLVASVTTDANGLATCNFGDAKAVYLVIERKDNTVVTTLQAPFFVAVPYADEVGAYDYIVDVYPKNDIIEEDVEIEKDVTEIDNDHSTYDVGEEHTWIIQSSIPAGLASGKKYEITDALDYRLTLKSVDKVSVAYDNGTFDAETDPAGKTEDAANAETFVLTAEEDYTVTVSKDVDVENREIDKFVVALTEAGMKKVAEYVDADYSNYEIRVYFTAVIDENGEMDVEIPNQAHVDYTNALDENFEDLSNIPEVHTGGLNVKKLSESVEGEVLSGAEFKLAEKAEGDEYDDIITVNGEKVKVNYVSFYPSDNFAGEKTDTAITNENGEAFLYGIAYGDYYLIETKAPAGYNKLTEAVEVKVDKGTQNADEVEGTWNIVINSQGVEMPSTGGMGTTILYIIGGVLVVAAVILLVTKKRMSNTK